MNASRTVPDRSSRRLAIAGAAALGGTALLLGGLALGDLRGALNASLRGVSVWWEVLFPALFPFFVLSELLLGFGIVHFAGKLLDPFMRPLFRLPGVGAFIVSMGSVSGYPVGARLTSRLMEQKLVTRDQGERLIAMTTTSDPIFLIGAVCIGFFGSPGLAPVLAVAHYGSALLIGFASRFGRRSAGASPSDQEEAAPSREGNRLRAALAAMHRARLADGRPLGVLLQQSLQSSLSLMIIVGGLVVFFSAALDLLSGSGLLAPLSGLFSTLLSLFGLAPDLAQAFMNGAFEVTLGAKAAAADGSVPLIDRAAVAAFVLSWAGLSVHAQVAGLMSGTPWRYWPFARARLVHGLLAMVLIYFLWPWIGPVGQGATDPAWARAGLAAWGPDAGGGFAPDWATYLLALPLLSLCLILSLVLFGMAWIGARRLAGMLRTGPRP